MTDIGTLEEVARTMQSAKYPECEEILLGNSFTRAKNLYTSLDPATRRSTMRTLIAERNRQWCWLTLYVIVYYLVWYLVPGRGDVGSPAWLFSLLVHVSSIVIFWTLIIGFTISSISVTLRVKHLRTLSNDEVSEVSDVQK